MKDKEKQNISMKEMLTKRSIEPITNCNCMKDKEKQIKSDCEKCIHDKVCYDCLMTDKCWGKDNNCKHYQPKLKDSVVLSREEYKQLLDNNIRVDLEYLERQLKQTSKETAEKIYRMADEICTGSQNDGDKILAMIKDTFGAEIKE